MPSLASSDKSESNMQNTVLNRATFRVANTTDMSGRATADKINCDLWTAKGSNLWRIACSTFLRSSMVAGLFIVLAPMSGGADDHKDRRGDNDKGISAEIAALQAQVASLQSTVSGLQGQVNALETANSDQQNEIKSLQTSNTALQNQLAHAKNVLALDPFVRVDPNPEVGVVGPNIIFSGANIHIVSGSCRTDDNGNPRGLGNLIIGYDDDPQHLFGGVPLNPGDRGGSHNLVIGDGNRFTQSAFGGLVAGTLNTISSYAASVSGGSGNTASGEGANVSGGFRNTASGEHSSVNGGIGNNAGGGVTVVIGGQNVADNNFASIAPQPPFP